MSPSPISRIAAALGSSPPVERVRALVLELAMRGMLVPEITSAGSASELLRTLITGVRAGERATSIDPSLARIERGPYTIPQSWEWIRLGAAFRYDAGLMRDPSQLNPDFWLFELEDIERDGRAVTAFLKAGDRASKSSKSEFRAGDVLFGKLRPYLNKVIVANRNGYSTTEIVAIRPTSIVNPDFAVWALRRPDFVQYTTAKSSGTKMPRLRTADAIEAPFPLPPLSQQIRIARAIEELMIECDRLEAAQAKREVARDKFAASVLHHLNNAPDAATRRTHAQFFINHLPRLTTRPDQIPAIRQTILNLAVRGALAHPSTDSAWPTVPLAALLSEDTQNGYSRKPDDAPDGIPILRINAATVRRDCYIDEQEYKRISGVSPSEKKKFSLEPGDLLACRFNGNRKFVGRFALFRDEFRLNPIYPDKLIRVRVSGSVILPELVRIFAESDLLRERIEAHCATTVGNWGISAGNLKKVGFPLPPLAEQHRIVAKVDQLLSICDQLESSLTTLQSARRTLLEATLHEALNPNTPE